MFKLLALVCFALAVNGKPAYDSEKYPIILDGPFNTPPPPEPWDLDFEFVPHQDPPPHFAGQSGCYVEKLDIMLARGERFTEPTKGSPILYRCSALERGGLLIIYKDGVVIRPDFIH